MSAGTICRIRLGRLAGKRCEVVSTTGRHITVKGSFGTTTVLASEPEAV